MNKPRPDSLESWFLKGRKDGARNMSREEKIELFLRYALFDISQKDLAAARGISTSALSQAIRHIMYRMQRGSVLESPTGILDLLFSFMEPSDARLRRQESLRNAAIKRICGQCRIERDFRVVSKFIQTTARSFDRERQALEAKLEKVAFSLLEMDSGLRRCWPEETEPEKK